MESRAFHFSSASMQVTSEKKKIATAMATTSSGDRAQQQTLKKAAMKENKAGQTQNNANVKKQEGEDGATQTRKCKKNDGKGWNCPNKASHLNSLCEYHLMKKRSYLSIEFASPVEEDKAMVAAPTTGSKSKLSDSSNTQKKKPIKNYDAVEGFYYYNGFGLSRGKRHCGNHPNKEEEVEMEPSKYACPLNRAKADSKDVTSNGATTSDDNVCNNNKSGCNNVNMERNKNPWKLSRKPVKVRALMSL